MPSEVATERQYLELLVKVGEILGESLDYTATLLNVCVATVESIADICLLDLGTPEKMYLAAAAHRDSSLTPELQHAGKFLRSERERAHPAVTVASTGNPVVVPYVGEAYVRVHAVSDEHEAFMRRMHYRSLMIVPLVSSARGIVGTLTLVRTTNDEPYSEWHVRFALDLARRCASAIAKAELFEKSQRIATQFQRAALPAALPVVDGFSFDGYYEPSSQELLVGGDWYDAFEMPDGRIAVSVGDVLGHGLDAAVWMSRLRNALRATLYTDPDPSRALAVVDRLMRLESQETFSTALVALLDPVFQTMTFSCAGHPGPLIFDPTLRCVIEAPVERSLPLGLRELFDGPRAAQTITLKRGMFFTFFTDGLLEWNHNVNDAWEVLIDVVGRQDVREGRRPARRVREAVIDGHAHEDDVAVLTIRVDALTRAEIRP